MTKARSNATAPAAKGELVIGTGTDTSGVLSVGNAGETLVADSSTTTGLRWQGNFAAGKNKIINGDFGIWQRGTSFSTGNGAYVYGPDRWSAYFYGSNTTTISQQSFTAGSAPVSGYEGQYFMRVSSSNTSTAFRQLVEDVRTFAGQTVTLSFWAKAASSITLGTYFTQNFGSGGSAAVDSASQSNSLTTSWQRFSHTISLASISGKTLGASSYLAVIFAANGVTNTNIDIWGVQLEAGSTATAFQTATGTVQGELAACQRYYVRFTSANVFGNYAHGSAYSTTAANIGVHLPVMMRANGPTSVDFSTLRLQDGVGAQTVTGLTLGDSSTDYALVAPTVASGLTQYRPYFLGNNNNVAGYIGFSAEL